MEKAIQIMERLPNITPLAARVGDTYWATECLESAMDLHELAAEERRSINRRPVYKMKDCRMGKTPVIAQGYVYKPIPLHRTAPWTFKEELGPRTTVAMEALSRLALPGLGKPSAPPAQGSGTRCRRVSNLHARGNTTHWRQRRGTHPHGPQHLGEVDIRGRGIAPLDTLGHLARLELCGAKFMLCGDYEGQFESIADR